MGLCLCRERKTQEKKETSELIDKAKSALESEINTNNLKIGELSIGITNELKVNNIKLAKNTASTLLTHEDYNKIINRLIPHLKKMNSNISQIIDSKTEPPENLKTPINEIIYSAKKLDIHELNEIKKYLQLKYGETYITDIEDNSKKIIEKDLVDMVNKKQFPDDVVMKKVNDIGKLYSVHQSKPVLVNPNVLKKIHSSPNRPRNNNNPYRYVGNGPAYKNGKRANNIFLSGSQLDLHGQPIPNQGVDADVVQSEYIKRAIIV